MKSNEQIVRERWRNLKGIGAFRGLKKNQDFTKSSQKISTHLLTVLTYGAIT